MAAGSISGNVEIHEVYAPFASATNVRNINSNIKSPGQNAASGNVPSATIEGPDNQNGSNSVATANEGQNIVVSGKNVNGRYDQSTVINNPA